LRQKVAGGGGQSFHAVKTAEAGDSWQSDAVARRRGVKCSAVHRVASRNCAGVAVITRASKA
jgi:hypothetical protein